MTETARVYGGSLYELAQEEHLEEEILSEMKEIRALFRENPEYPRLLAEPSICLLYTSPSPRDTR